MLTGFLLSQHADDTQIFLNGSETSLLAILGIFKKICLMPGLKVHEDKTKALWMGIAKQRKEGSFRCLAIPSLDRFNVRIRFEVLS